MHKHRHQLPSSLEGTHGTLITGQLEMSGGKSKGHAVHLQETQFHQYLVQCASLADPRWYKRAPTCYMGKPVRWSDRSGKPITCANSKGNKGACVYEAAEAGPWGVHSAQISSLAKHRPQCP